MKPIRRQPHISRCVDQERAADAGALDARLRVIHDLVRSGDYHVPATAIAERMIEQMVIQRRERS